MNAAKLNLAKPAIEHNAAERREIFAKLFSEIKAGMTPCPVAGRLTGQQIAWAKGRTFKLMAVAGF